MKLLMYSEFYKVLRERLRSLKADGFVLSCANCEISVPVWEFHLLSPSFKPVSIFAHPRTGFVRQYRGRLLVFEGHFSVEGLSPAILFSAL